MDDPDPEVARFALAVLHLDLDVRVEKPRVSMASTLRFDVTLANNGREPFEQFRDDGSPFPFVAEVIPSVGGAVWSVGAIKVNWIAGDEPKPILIQPGHSFHIRYELPLPGAPEDVALELDPWGQWIEGKIPPGPYVLEVSFFLYRDIAGKRRVVSLEARSRPFEIVEPALVETPGEPKAAFDPGIRD